MTRFWHAYHDRLVSGDYAYPDDFFYERLTVIESFKRGLDIDGANTVYWPTETEEAIQHRLELFRPFTEEEEEAADASGAPIAWAVENHARCCGCRWGTRIVGPDMPNGIFAGWTKEQVGGGWLQEEGQ